MFLRSYANLQKWDVPNQAFRKSCCFLYFIDIDIIRYHVFLLLYYMKIYPPQQSLSLTIIGKEGNTARLVSKLSDMALELSDKINLIQRFWDERFDETNLLPHLFGCFTTGCLDVFPLYRRRSTSKMIRDRTYNGKYKHQVDKFQIICDHLGRCIWLSGPHPGSDHDGNLWSRFNPIHKMTAFETILADKAYIGQPKCVSQFKKTSKTGLSEIQKGWNSVHGFYRVIVEHTIGFSKFFGILRQDYRGQVGLSDESMKQIQNFARLIFEISNLHWFLSDKKKRDLRPFFVDDKGNNLLPRIDDSPDMLLLRKRLASVKGHYVSNDQTILQRHINTGYDSSYFSEGDRVWLYRPASRSILKAEIWAISKENDFGTDNISYSVRTSKGNYDVRIPPSMLIPAAINHLKHSRPKIEDFVLYRESEIDKARSISNNTFLSMKSIAKSLESNAQIASMLRTEKVSLVFKQRTIQRKLHEQLHIVGSIRSNFESLNSEKFLQGPSSIRCTSFDDMLFSESTSSSSDDDFEGVEKEDYLDSSRSNYENSTNIAKSVLISLVDEEFAFKSICDENDSKPKLKKRKLDKDTEHVNEEEVYETLNAFKAKTVNTKTARSKSMGLVYEVEPKPPQSFVQKETFEERGSHPLIPKMVENKTNFLDEMVFVCFIIFSSCRFPAILNFFISPISGSYYNLIVLRAIRYSMEMIQICRELDVHLLTASFQLAQPNFFCGHNFHDSSSDSEKIHSVFKEMLLAIFFEEDFYYNNSYHRFTQVSTLSLRMSTLIRTKSDQIFKVQDNSLPTELIDPVESFLSSDTLPSNSLSVIEKMEGQDPYNIILYLDNAHFSPQDHLEASDVLVNIVDDVEKNESIACWRKIFHSKYPSSIYVCAMGVCKVGNHYVIVHISEKYVIFMEGNTIEKAKFVHFQSIPNVTEVGSNSSTFSFFSTCIMILCERENFAQSIFKHLNPLDQSEEIEIQTELIYDRNENVDYNCIPHRMGGSVSIIKYLLSDSEEELSDFLIQDIFDTVFQFLPSGFLLMSYPISFSTVELAYKTITSQCCPSMDTVLIINVLFRSHFFVLAVSCQNVSILDSMEWGKDKTEAANVVLRRLQSLHNEIAAAGVMSDIKNGQGTNSIFEREKVDIILNYLSLLPQSMITVGSMKESKVRGVISKYGIVATFPSCMKQSNIWCCGLMALFNAIAYTGFWDSPATQNEGEMHSVGSQIGIAKRTRQGNEKMTVLNDSQLQYLKFLFSLVFLRDRLIIHSSVAKRRMQAAAKRRKMELPAKGIRHRCECFFSRFIRSTV